MNVTCPNCQLEYNDTYRVTSCPHLPFQMHCGVFVKGERGCAHSLEEQEAALRKDNPILPNPDCTMNQLAKAYAEDRPLEALFATAGVPNKENYIFTEECLKNMASDEESGIKCRYDPERKQLWVELNPIESEKQALLGDQTPLMFKKEN